MITLVAEFNGEVWHNELCHYLLIKPFSLAW